MLDPCLRKGIFEELFELERKFMSDLEDSLYQEYSRYGQAPDKEAPFMEALFRKQEQIHDLMDEHLRQLNFEFREYEEEAI